MISIERRCLGRSLALVAIPMGRDLALCISGGDLPHVGGTAFAWASGATSELDGGSASASACVSAPGHRDAELAEEMAMLVRDAKAVNVSVACGIHYDGASAEDIRAICQAVREMARELLEML